ncbi:hypothetical protein PRIPAC_77149 [Pristionchus pacificus]|uniref:Nuclear receptor n=1 Tax=Pristionchus pacificus TaxID=54126 RepID=A0A2A6CKQ4_PRIPA|nr:hypothetical protein PRIPAC_77149 [Pristionchus pacificus]|eukprot:PDM78699.1 nuclear receptor [Pristionchus pacificus]
MPAEAICLICSVPIHNSNLGIDSCRACAVFYRRHLNDKELRCRKGTNDCIEKNVRPHCRKCRFAKFAAVLGEYSLDHQQTILPADSEDPGSSSSEGNSIHESKDKSRHFNFFSSFTEKSSLFDRMKKAYSNALKGDGQVFYTVNYGAKLSSLAILKSGLMQFCEAVFDEFSLLPQDDKDCIIEKSALTIQSIDGLYRAAHHFPGLKILTPTYTFYVNSRIIDDFEDGFAFNNVPEIIRDMKDNFTNFVDNIRVRFDKIKPSNEEFLAMIGLSLWSSEETELNENIVRKHRSRILSELHKLYANRGIEDYSSRLGEIFCLLESIEKTVESAEEGISMINLMNSINLHD